VSARVLKPEPRYWRMASPAGRPRRRARGTSTTIRYTRGGTPTLCLASPSTGGGRCPCRAAGSRRRLLLGPRFPGFAAMTLTYQPKIVDARSDDPGSRGVPRAKYVKRGLWFRI